MENEASVFTGMEFEQISGIITTRTGLVFPKNREAEFRQSLLEAYGESSEHPTFDAYLRAIETNSLSKKESRKLIARLTVGETYFFRNKPQFDLLRERILPDLIHRRTRTTRMLRLWSAGCSTGEEAYSLAILLHETVPQIAKWNIYILATDISEDSLDLAERGEYREWSFREVAPDIKERYFTKTGNGYKMHPEIRKMVTFRYLNIIEDIFPLASNGTNFMDLIMCRNVMMYFKPSFATAITKRFFRALNNGGHLIVGHTEHTENVFAGFQKDIQSHAVIYTKDEKWTEWDRGLKLRFRGSGYLPGNVVPRRLPARPEDYAKEKSPADRYEIRQETALFEEGVGAYNLGQIRMAESCFRKVAAMNPKNHRALYMLALMEANQGHLKKAEEYSRKAIEGFPLSLEAYYLLAVVAREMGEKDKELENLKKVIYINRDFILGHYQMGIYYLKEGNFFLARKCFSNALKLLDTWTENDYIDGTEGMTVGRLRESIMRYLNELEEERQPLLEQ